MDLSFLKLGQLDQQTQRYFEQLFQFAGQNQACVTGQQVAKFYQLTGLSTDILRSIWNLSSVYKQPFLSKLEFYLSLKYVSLAQAGQFGDPQGTQAFQNLKQVHSLLGLPRFQGFEVPGLQSQLQNHNPFGSGPSTGQIQSQNFNPFGNCFPQENQTQSNIKKEQREVQSLEKNNFQDDDWGDFEKESNNTIQRQQQIDDAFEQVLNPNLQNANQPQEPKQINLGDFGLKKKVPLATSNQQGFMQSYIFKDNLPQQNLANLTKIVDSTILQNTSAISSSQNQMMQMQQPLKQAVDLSTSNSVMHSANCTSNGTNIALLSRPQIDNNESWADAFNQAKTTSVIQNIDQQPHQDDEFGDFGDFKDFNQQHDQQDDDNEFGNFQDALDSNNQQKQLASSNQNQQTKQKLPDQNKQEVNKDPFAQIIKQKFNVVFEKKLTTDTNNLEKNKQQLDFKSSQAINSYPSELNDNCAPDLQANDCSSSNKQTFQAKYCSSQMSQKISLDDPFASLDSHAQNNQQQHQDTGFGDFADFDQNNNQQKPENTLASNDDGFGDFGDFQDTYNIVSKQISQPQTIDYTEENAAKTPQISDQINILLTKPANCKLLNSNLAQDTNISQAIQNSTAQNEDDGFGDFGDFEDTINQKPEEKATVSNKIEQEDPFAEIMGEFENKGTTQKEILVNPEQASRSDHQIQNKNEQVQDKSYINQISSLNNSKIENTQKMKECDIDNDGFGDFGEIENINPASVRDQPNIMAQQSVKDPLSIPQDPFENAFENQSGQQDPDDGFGDFGNFSEFEQANIYDKHTNPLQEQITSEELIKTEQNDVPIDQSKLELQSDNQNKTANLNTNITQQAQDQEADQEDGFDDFGEFENHTNQEDDLSKHLKNDEQISLEALQEDEKPAAVPKKPLTESDLLSGFMSAFGSSLSRKMTVQTSKVTNNVISNLDEHSGKDKASNIDDQDDLNIQRAQNILNNQNQLEFLSFDQQVLKCQTKIDQLFAEIDLKKQNQNSLKQQLLALVQDQPEEYFDRILNEQTKYKAHLELIEHQPTITQLFEQYARDAFEIQEFKNEMRQHVESEEFEEAAACKKKVKAYQASQEAIKDQVTLAITSFIEKIDQGHPETVKELCSRDVLQTILNWESKFIQSITLTEIMIKSYEVACHHNLPDQNILDVLLYNVIIFLEVNKTKINKLDQHRPEESAIELEYQDLCYFLQNHLKGIQNFHQKVNENLEVTFDDEEIEKLNTEVILKVCQNQKVKQMLKALLVIQRVACVVHNSISIQHLFMAKSINQNRERYLNQENLLQQYEKLEQNIDDLKKKLIEQHKLFAEEINSVELEFEQPQTQQLSVDKQTLPISELNFDLQLSRNKNRLLLFFGIIQTMTNCQIETQQFKNVFDQELQNEFDIYGIAKLNREKKVKLFCVKGKTLGCREPSERELNSWIALDLLISESK